MHWSQQPGRRGEYKSMRIGDVDTGKFASWPLLRPDELAALPSEVLKASLAALDLLCGQTSDGELVRWRTQQYLGFEGVSKPRLELCKNHKNT